MGKIEGDEVFCFVGMQWISNLVSVDLMNEWMLLNKYLYGKSNMWIPKFLQIFELIEYFLQL